MKLIGFILILLGFLLLVNPILAIDTPIQTSPDNDASVSASILSWQAPNYPLASSNPFQVQVSSSSAFTAPQRDYQTNNTSYKPSLTLGQWFWRIRAKDDSGNYSDWSTVESFTLTTPAPTPSPSDSTTPVALFTISEPPNSADATDTLTIAASIILPNNPNSQFYLKGAFAESGSSNYFGKTYVENSWVKNSQTFTNQFPITTDNQGNWNGNILVMADPDDSGFNGEDDYILKVARYSMSGDLTWSNSYPIHLRYTPPSTPSPLITPSITPTITPHLKIATITGRYPLN